MCVAMATLQGLVIESPLKGSGQPVRLDLAELRDLATPCDGAALGSFKC